MKSVVFTGGSRQVAFEILIRWLHQELGLLAAFYFVAIVSLLLSQHHKPTSLVYEDNERQNKRPDIFFILGQSPNIHWKETGEKGKQSESITME